MTKPFTIQFAFVLFLLSAVSSRAAVVEYDLEIGWQEITIGGRTAEGMTINGGIPGPTLFFTEGDTARIRVRNTMDVATSIHWHGILVPPGMDGVPFVTQPPIAPGATFVYEFPIRQSGTYWYHSHSGLQEQRGLYGSIVIAPQHERITADRDRVVLLSDWTGDSPGYVLQTLKRGSEWYALEKGSAQSIVGAGMAGRLSDYYLRELQRMPPMDLADVAYDAFLANGKPETAIEAGAGETVRLRVIDGSATTYFHLEFAGGPMTIVTADGQEVEPVEKQRFLVGAAETYDVLVTLPGPGSYEFRATAHDGSGHASVWLGSGMKHPAAAIPRPDVYRSMHHGSFGSLFALTPAGSMGMSDRLVEQGAFDQPGMGGMDHDMGGHDMGQEPSGHEGSDHGMSHEMEGHDPGHVSEHHPEPDMVNGSGGYESTGHDGMDLGMESGDGHDMAMDDAPMAMDEGMVGHGDMESGHAMGAEMEPAAPPTMTMVMEETGSTAPANGRRFGSRFAPLVADAASRGELAVEGSAARPLTPYAELRALGATGFSADKEVREIRLTLDGDMERYVWFLNNKPLSESDHILIREGEVVRFIMINRTMMHHPMHLHGHFFRVLNGQGDRAPLKHTVDVAPMSTTVFEFYSDEPGDWFFHCHLLYHMKSGMARMVHYRDFTPSEAVQSVRPQLYRDSWYLTAEAQALSNMTEGMVTLANTRLMLDLAWEAGWEGDADEEEWEGIARLSWYFNRFATVFVGGRSEGVRSKEHETVAIIGFRYLLPLYIESTVWVDDEGESRVVLEKEFELTPRLALRGETEYDSVHQWEGAVDLTYMLNRHFSLAGKWHSEFGWGGGIQIGF